MALILDGTNGMSDVDGSAATPAIRGSDANTGVFFGTDIVGVSTGGAERMRVDASGNVQIGTTTVSSPNTDVLTVGKASSSFDAIVRVRQFNNGTAAGLHLVANNDAGATFNAIRSLTEGGTTHWSIGGVSGAAGALPFSTSGAERARIDSSGNLLVGQSALNGAGKIEIAYDRASSWGMQIRNTTGTTAATTYIAFKYVNTQTGYIESTGSTTSYVTTSDYRLKENIEPMTGALAKVAQLKPCTYTWKTGGTAGEGFIAHELQEVCPSAVSGVKDAINEDGSIKPQGIDTSFLVATLTAAIQEQQAIITALTARVEALEGAQA